MMYSSAVFETPDMSLADAQRAKLDRLCTKLVLGPDDHVLEIGTGWGGFAVHAAQLLRLPGHDHDHLGRPVRLRVQAGGRRRPGRAQVTVLDRDYRDLGGTYDKLVSIEMIEAVDWRQYDTSSAPVPRSCGRDGLMALQAITMDDRSFERAKNSSEFVVELIFPGGCVPSVESITRSLRRATPLTIIDLEDIGRHYVETLHRWSEKVGRNRDEISALGIGPQVRAAVGPVPLLLRGCVRRAPHQRRPAGVGHARLEGARWLSVPDPDRRRVARGVGRHGTVRMASGSQYARSEAILPSGDRR